MIRFILCILILGVVGLCCTVIMFAFGMSDNNPRTPWTSLATTIGIGALLIALVEFSPYLLRFW